jgi:DMSO/TMAO reductase YedYZ molybdopterin-dependent catalytic subunit
VVGGAGLAYAGVEGVVRVAGLRGAERRFTGSYERGSGRPEEMPVTQWFDDAVPSIDAGSWQLDIVAADATVRRWSYEELAGFEDTVRATLDCTGGWYASQVWEGVWLSRLLSGTGEARSLKVVSVTGYPRRFPIEDRSHLLLATRVGGRALDAGHGFPARLVAPGRRGFWWVKWVARVEASPIPWWWQWPFPVT